MRYFISILLFLQFTISVQAQKILTAVRHRDLMTEQTLKITQDQKGFIWVSNRFGIDRYDGYSVKHYEIAMLANANPVRYINVMANRSKEIYAYTSNGGIYQYDVKSDRFLLLNNLNFYVRTVSLSEEGGIWFGAKGKLGLIKNKKISTFEPQILKGLLVKSLINYAENKKIIVSDYGLFWFDVVHNQVKPLLAKELHKDLLKVQLETAYWDEKKQTLWIGTVNNGLLTYHIPTKQLSSIASPLANQAMVMCIGELNDNTLIIGTDGTGAFLVDKDKKKVVREFSEYNSEERLSGDAVYDVFKDKDRRIWIATDGGINVMESPLTGFHIELKQNEKPNILAKDLVTAMLQDKAGNLWFGTNGGLSIKDQSGKVTFPLQSTYVLSLYEARNGTIWVGTYGTGVYVLSRQGDILNHYMKNNRSEHTLATNFIYAITEDKHGNIWLGGKKGLSSRFETSTQKFRHLPLGHVNHFTIKENGNILAATEAGVLEIEPTKLRATEHPITKVLKSKYVCDLYLQSDSLLWLATYGAGLVRYETKTGKLKYVSTSDKSVQEVTFSILPDNQGQVWLAGKDKISSINLNTLAVKNYPKKLMHLNMSFFQTARMKSNKGELYFGGTKGFVSFNPTAISTPRYAEKIVFLNFNLFNKVVNVDEEGSPLQAALDNTANITLTHDQHSFAFSFTTINFSQTVERRFKWKLDGLDNNWVGPTPENTANYTNLAPGKYVFHVKAIGNNNEVLDERVIQVVMQPAFYKTWFAFLIYAMLFAGLVYWWMQQTKTRAYLLSSLEFEKKEKKRAEELTQSKLDFFTNVSHEIRTPVTLILGQTEQLLNTTSSPTALQGKLQGIYQQASSLGNLVNELLDFRKQEEGHVQLYTDELELIGFLYDVYYGFLSLAQQKAIRFDFDPQEPAVYVSADKSQLKKVVNNLLSNAFKAVSEGDQIVLAVKLDHSEVIITVSDTGKGIPIEQIKHIFNPFYQLEQTATPGTGIGLAIAKSIIELHGGTITVTSTIHQGSKFTIRLPKMEKLATAGSHNPSSKSDSFTIDQPVIQMEQVDEKKTVVLVEDNDELRDFIQEVLTPMFHVHVANNGETGLELANRQQPDLVISDVMMPGMSGTDLCRKLKSSFDTCHIPVVLLTAKSAIDHQLEGLRTGADDYVIKPFHTKLLIQRCNNLINARQVLKAKYYHQPGLAKQQEVATTVIDKKFIDQATSIVEAHLHRQIDVNFLASEMGLSRSSLFSKLKGITGLTPNTFIANIRLKKAADLLQHSPELNISQIAYNLDFSSPRYFNKCFREQYGCAPQEYRKKHV